MEKKYLVIGTGAIGTVFGGLLQNSGKNVSYLGKGEHFDKIIKDGIKINGIWGDYLINPINAYQNPDEINEKFDIILLAVKSSDTKDAAIISKELIKTDGICVSLQNGLGNVEKIKDILGESRCVGARVIFGVDIKTPGIATVTVYADKVLIGRPFIITENHNIISLEQDLNTAGIPTEITNNIIGYIWAKALYNCALNPLGAILKCSYGELGENKNTRNIMENIIKEIYLIAKEKNIKMLIDKPDDYIDYFYNKLLPPTKEHHSSMYQDLKAGRATEIDALNNAVNEYADLLGIQTPYNKAVTGMVKFLEAKL
jgi:2-dehydropantoate 2-reductase